MVTGFEWCRSGGRDYIRDCGNATNRILFANRGDTFTYRVYYRPATRKADLYVLIRKPAEWRHLLTSVGYRSKPGLPSSLMFGDYSNAMGGDFAIDYVRWRAGWADKPKGDREDLVNVTAGLVSGSVPEWAEPGEIPLVAQIELSPESAKAFLEVQCKADQGSFKKGFAFGCRPGSNTVALPLLDAPPGKLNVTVTLRIGAKRLAVGRWQGAIRVFRTIRTSLKRGSPSELTLDEAILLRDLSRYAEGQPSALRIREYVTAHGQHGEAVTFANPMASGIVLYWPYHGRYALTAGVTSDTRRLSAQFGHGTPTVCRHRTLEARPDPSELQEIYLGRFDNSQPELRIRIGVPANGTLAYVKAMPFVRRPRPESRLRGNRRVLVDNDGFSPFCMGMSMDAQAMARETRRYRGTDVLGVVWCVGNPLEVNYRSRVAPLYFEGTERFPRRGDRRVHDAVRGYINEGEDTLDAMIRVCRENGLLCFASLRMNRAPNPVYDEGRPLPQYDQLKPYRIHERPGTQGKYLSYAFPEVREHALSLFGEMAERGPDGILAEFTRVPPYVGHHPTLVRRFRERYRLPPGAAISPVDPRWLKV